LVHVFLYVHALLLKKEIILFTTTEPTNKS